jgi:hypothetical protein
MFDGLANIVGNVFPTQPWSRLTSDSEKLRNHLLTAAALDGGVPGECIEQRGAQTVNVGGGGRTLANFVSIVEHRRGQLRGDQRGQIRPSFHRIGFDYRRLGTRHSVPVRAYPCNLLDNVIEDNVPEPPYSPEIGACGSAACRGSSVWLAAEHEFACGLRFGVREAELFGFRHGCFLLFAMLHEKMNGQAQSGSCPWVALTESHTLPQRWGPWSRFYRLPLMSVPPGQHVNAGANEDSTGSPGTSDLGLKIASDLQELWCAILGLNCAGGTETACDPQGD